MQVIRKPVRARGGAPARPSISTASVLLLIVLMAAPAIAPAAAADGTPQAALAETLAAGAPPVTDIDAALGAAALAALKATYAARDDRPIWLDAGSSGQALLDRLSGGDVALDAKLRPLVDDARKRLSSSDPQARAGADLLLTALFGANASALRPDQPKRDFAAALAKLAATDDVAALLQAPAPATPKVEATPAEAPALATPTAAPEPAEIARLKAAIAARAPQAARGWPQVPAGPKLQLGDSGPRVEALSRRLIASGDLKATTPGAEFDLPLQTALQHFQARHGLAGDGVAGEATIAALNVPLKDRLASLAANLRRLESADRAWGERYLEINIPAARYRHVETGSVVAEGPVLLGAAATPTPLIDGMIDRVLLHPAWRIPQSIADRALWPRQDQDATYFYNHGIRVSDEGLRQVPGPGNPLGLVKLLIAGNDRIALHGLPAGSTAFDLPDRYTSLGCVALADAAALAKALIAADPAWPEGRIDSALAAGGTETVDLKQPLPLHIVYDTAWVDADGTVEVRDDVYGWDKAMPAADPNGVAVPCGS
jgi:murein L,D-transpeptidase YcbB/YkuD